MLTLPEPSVTPLRGGPTLRWGVLGPGGIAQDWVSTVHRHTDQRVVAVASRSSDRSQAFAVRHGIPHAFEGHEALLASPDVDVVYVAAPHAQHRPLALAAIAAGKHVLIEKPMALDAQEAEEISQAAKAAGVFAMEAMWTRYLPQSDLVSRLLADGAVGEVRTVTADLGWRWEYSAGDPRFDPTIGGGVMIDAGVYPLWFAHSVLGPIDSVHAIGSVAPTTAEIEAVIALRSASGALASLSASATTTTPGLASVYGTTGSILFDSSFVFPARLRILSDGGEHEWADESGLAGRDGLAWQATALAAYVAEGRTQSPLHSLDDSIAVLRVLDDVRRQIRRHAE
ncbi:Gfo/Idh/MocA family oxidoreductase [Microbacterium sp. M28]|uniref:Gfo/Idh/MocA family protein n=1 Tax=Microbacterium sp. M28 TaxID=2962064 RepID=UPI0021F44280|nr:Gfo/Idh/MocA family oxidoreductase [Microbacterium sp. M28]UYO96170.1 Gfo/Idh/MocA family oxidoreductase [Microbacterium sp. M28]